MTLNPLRLATEGFFTSLATGENTLNPATLNAITGAVWTYTSRSLSSAAGLTPAQEATLNSILNQLIADWKKGETKYQRFLPGTNTLILDKAVVFDPDTGFTVTQAD